MKAKINLSNIKGFIQGNYRKVLEDFGFLDKHIEEQAEWRLSQVAKKSPECLREDKCTHCGCQVSAKVFEDRACEGGCYPVMMNNEEWDQYKYYNSVLEQGPMIIRDFSKEETLADLMQNNPDLSKEELLYWCPEFKDK